LDKLCTCKGDDRLFSVHVYLLISSIGLSYFQRKKGGQFTTVDCHLLECITYTTSQITKRAIG